MNLKFLSALLFAFGILDSSYLLYEHYLFSLPYCPVNSCYVIPELPFPSFILPLLGLLWFFAGIFLFYLRSYKLLLRIWQISGLAGALSLFTYSVLIDYFCPYCHLAHACGLILVLISFRMTYSV